MLFRSIEANARLDLKGHDGKTPLDLAIEYGYNEIADMIRAKINKTSFIPGENDVKSFVHKWFSWFDRQASEEKFLAHLSDKDLLIEFPEATLKNKKDFLVWYRGILKNIKSNTHDLRSIKVSKENDSFEVEVHVCWKALTYDGKVFDLEIKQNWKLLISDNGKLIIERYIVKVL